MWSFLEKKKKDFRREISQALKREISVLSLSVDTFIWTI